MLKDGKTEIRMQVDRWPLRDGQQQVEEHIISVVLLRGFDKKPTLEDIAETLVDAAAILLEGETQDAERA